MLVDSANKEIVLRGWYEELWNRWNVDVVDDLFDADYRLHLSGVPAVLDRAAVRDVVKTFKAAFPDFHHTVDEVIAEGPAVAVRWTVHGTHQGELQGIAASGQRITLSGTTVHHLRHDRIVETWLTFDNRELRQQLGAE